MDDYTAWALSILSFAAIVVSIAVAARAIAGEPAAGRRRCPKCWHDLGPSGHASTDPSEDASAEASTGASTGLSTDAPTAVSAGPSPVAAGAEGAPDPIALRCPECGHCARSEAETLKTRRRPWRAAAALAIAFGVTTVVRVRVLDSGLWASVPSGVLILAIPYTPDGSYRSAAWQLSQRILRGSTDTATIHAALELFVAGDADAPAGSPAWRAKYRDLGSAVLSRLEPDDPEQLRLMEIPPVVACEPVHGASEPRLLALDADVWWPASIEGRAEIVFPDGSTKRARFSPDGRFPPLYIELPESMRAGDAFVFRLAFRSRGAIVERDEDGWTAYPDIAVSVPAFEPASAFDDDAWRPADSPEMRELVASVFGEGLIVWMDGVPRAGLRFNARATDTELFAGVAVGLVIEICEDGVPRRTSNMWWRGGSFAGQPRWTPAAEDLAALARLYDEAPGAPSDPAASAPATGARWTLRIRGDERLARRAMPARDPNATRREASDDGSEPALSSAIPTRWFSGSIEVPLAVERARSRAPSRRWRP